ncbi:MAG: protein kinase, partial [Burkholderiales bacterium]|nr:protein kinase [Burkholderiales bacterium]
MEKIGKYQVTRKLGEGASSEVYLCHDPFTDREVAIKVVFPDSLADVDNRNLFKKLFITEASLAGKLTHPHIVQIHDAVLDEGISYVVMDYVDGGTLEPHCRADALLPVDRVVEIIFKCT